MIITAYFFSFRCMRFVFVTLIGTAAFPSTQRTEFSQSLRYLNFSIFSTQSYFDRATFCEKDVRVQQVNWCVEGMHVDIEKLGDNHISHWNRSNFSPSCTYTISQSGTMERDGGNKYFLLFKIYAINCHQTWKSSLGGASFELYTRGHCLNSCWIKDNFDDSYDVNCEYCLTNFKASTQDECRIVDLAVDFERFDAFSERGTYFEHQYRHLQSVILKNIHICSRHNIHGNIQQAVQYFSVSSTTQHLRNTGHNSFEIKGTELHHNFSTSIVDSGQWIFSKNQKHSSALDDQHNNLTESRLGPADIFWKDVPYSELGGLNYSNVRLVIRAASHAFTWKWLQRGWDALPNDLLDCIRGHMVTFIGESHMRFLWDFFATALGEGGVVKDLDRHHSNVDVLHPPFRYRQALFARHAATQLRSMCDEALALGDNIATYHTVVFQTGAWDTSYWTTQFILNVTGPEVIASIQQMKERGCDKYIRLVWVNAVPYPRCDIITTVEERGSCEENRYARNNYVLAAFNSYMERSLSALNYKNLQFVDAYNILLPRIYFGEVACLNHYMCRMDSRSDEITSTPGGVVVAEAISRAICRVAYHGEK